MLGEDEGVLTLPGGRLSGSTRFGNLEVLQNFSDFVPSLDSTVLHAIQNHTSYDHLQIVIDETGEDAGDLRV